MKADIERGTKALALADPKLAKLMTKAGPCTMELTPTESTFEALSRSIVYQQLHAKAAKTIHDRAIALFPGRATLQPADVLTAKDDLLRSAGLSRNKVLALRDLAEKHESSALPTFGSLLEMGDESIIEALSKVRGIGRWSVEMLLMFRLGRLDILPTTDYGVRKGFALTFTRSLDLPDAKTMLRRGERWRPYRSIASWYLWRAVDLSSSK